MPQIQTSILTMNILFGTESQLKSALVSFNSWCRSHSTGKNAYGFVRTGKTKGQLFLISHANLQPILASSSFGALQLRLDIVDNIVVDTPVVQKISTTPTS